MKVSIFLILLAPLLSASSIANGEGTSTSTDFAANSATLSSDNWNYIGSSSNIEFYWRYHLKKSSVRIKAVNRSNKTLTIKIRASGGGEEKEITYYSIKPGGSDYKNLCASMKDYGCEHIRSVYIQLLSAR